MWRHLWFVPFYLLTTTLPFVWPVLANLEYEYALVSSYLALIFLPLAALLLPPRFLAITTANDNAEQSTPEDGSASPSLYYAPIGAAEFFWVCFISPILALLPVIYAYASQHCACSLNGTGFWLLVQWYPSWILAHAGMHLILRLRVHSSKRWRIGLCYYAVLLALTSYAFAKLWFNPQKRLIHFLTGFWHGPIYDDWIQVDAGLLWMRGAHFFLALALLLCTWLYRKQWKHQLLLILSIGFCGAISTASALLGSRFPSTKNSQAALQHLLPATMLGDGFTLHYMPPSIAEPLPIQRLFRDAQFHVQEIRQALSGKNPHTAFPHVQIYVYPDADKKKLWFGGDATDVTDVVTPSIHITDDQWPHPTLRHELVHALSSRFAFHGLGFHPNMAFTEGLAVALAPEPRSLSIDDGAAALLKSKRIQRVEDLFSPQFWRVSGGRAYTAAGSLIRYLVDTHGIDGVTALYSGKSWQEAFQTDRQTIVRQWQDHILASYDQEKNTLYTESLFRYPGILQDRCPHSKADLERDRNDSVFTRMRQPIGWDPERDYLPWLISLDKSDPEARLRLWRREIRKLASDRFTTEGRLDTWLEAVEKARTQPPKTLEDIELGILASDLTRQLGDDEQSIEQLEELKSFGEQHYLGDTLTREVQARLELEQTLASDEALEWRRYLAGWRRAIPESSTGHGSWLISYLKLRNERTIPLKEVDLLPMLDVTPPLDLAKSFHFEWYKILAQRLMRTGAFQAAATAYQKASLLSPPGSRELYLEHARRAAFYQNLGPFKSTAKH